MTTLSTRANSINRALDEIGDKWCLLIIQEVFWGINTFTGMLESIGASRGVLSDRLKWLQKVGCLRKALPGRGRRGGTYHLTRKSIDLYDSAMMAVEWERRYYRKPALDAIKLVHNRCGKAFSPRMQCRACTHSVDGREVSYSAGPGATMDAREKKVRRRSSISVDDVPSERSVYRNLINLVGDRWTANLIALAFHGHSRFEAFHRELPVATNILADRLRLLEQAGVFSSRAYRQRPRRFEYYLTEKGWDLFPYFVTLLQWGDRWCDDRGYGPPIVLQHKTCGHPLHGEVVCDQCGEPLKAYNVRMTLS